MRGLLKDIAFAFRALLKRPGFLVTATLTLGIGIGANTAIFSFVSSLILRPLPFRHQEQLVSVREKGPHQSLFVAPGDYVDWYKDNTVLDELAAYSYRDFTISAGSGEQDSDAVLGAAVTANFFQTLGVTPELGRVFSSDEEETGADTVVILSHSLWLGWFGSDPSIVGRDIALGDRRCIVVGIMPAGFDFPLGGVDVWVPLALSQAQKKDHRAHSLMTVGRMKPGYSVAQSGANFQAVAAQIAIAHPATNAGRSAVVVPLREQSGEYTGPFLWVLQAAAGFVMLIACANVAGLQLVRTISRRKEIAVRITLGAKRWPVTRLVLAESLVLSLTGSMVGIGIAFLAVKLLKTVLRQDLARFIMGWNQISLDGSVLAFALISAAGAAILSGSSPAFRSFGLGMTDSLRTTDQAVQDKHSSYLRKALLIAEVALTVVMTVAAGQMVRGFNALIGQNKGFVPEHVLTLHLGLPEHRYEWRQTGVVYERLVNSIRTLPSVEAAAAVSNLPGGTRLNAIAELRFEGKPEPAQNDYPVAEVQAITPEYFDALSIAVRQGRAFSYQDGPDAVMTAVISESMARQYWPGETPLGKRLRIVDESGAILWRTIVGVTADVRQNWFDTASRPVLYLPISQFPRRWMYLAIRDSGNPWTVLEAVRTELHRIDPHIPIYDAKPLTHVIDEAIAGIRVAAFTMEIFGAVALILAAVGIYGLMTYSVTQRQKEFGIRLAFGAHPGALRAMVLRQGIALTAAGLAIGAPAAAAVMRLMSGLLFGIAPRDINVILSVSLLMLATAVAACYLPARSASLADPMADLRSE